MIAPNVTIKNSIIMGCDFYDARQEVRDVGLEIGEGSVIENAIIDKNVSMGKNVRIVNGSGREESDLEHPACVIRDGIPIVIKNATLTDGWDLDRDL
jgi:glucose-1-phosphate adenylyltransferase